MKNKTETAKNKQSFGSLVFHCASSSDGFNVVYRPSPVIWHGCLERSLLLVCAATAIPKYFREQQPKQIVKERNSIFPDGG